MSALFSVITGTQAHGQAVQSGSATPPAPDGIASRENTHPDTGVAEIVVTAQKRSQRLSDVGISVAVASGEQLRTSGITDIAGLRQVVPGFSAATSSFGYPVFSLRGVSFNSLSASAPPAVSTYLDEAALPYPAMTGGLLLDVERVEVLKGPQGTLFGQNATGGSINVISAKPTREFHAGIATEVDNFGQVMLTGYISGPITDTLRARVAASTTQFGAWQKGYYLSDQKNGDQNLGAARLLLEWTPDDRLALSLNVTGSYDHGEAQQGQAASVTPVIPAASPPGFIGYPSPHGDRDADFDAGFNTHKQNYTVQNVLRADYKLGNSTTVTSITNYIRSKSRTPIDNDGTAIPVIVAEPFSSFNTFSQELRIAGSLSQARLHYIIGANYQRDIVHDDLIDTSFAYSGLPRGVVEVNKYRVTNRAVGLFANVDYDLTSKLTLTGGARYTSTRQTLKGCTADGGNGLFSATVGGVANILRAASGLPPTNAYLPGQCILINDVGSVPAYLPVSADLAQKEDNVSWRAGLNYKPTTSSLIYGLISRGYKAGSFPAQISLVLSSIRPVKQESVTSYEIGVKQSIFDRRLQVNLTGFYYDYRNKQFFTYVPVGGFINVSTVVNVPRSSVKGLDIDFTARPTDRLSVRGSATLLDTNVNRYSGFNYLGMLTDFSGKEFNYAPRFSTTADVEYRVPIASSLEGYVGGSMVYNSRTFADLGEPDGFRINSYTVLDARVGIRARAGWQAGLFVRNLTNEYYWTSVVSGGDSSVRYTGRPRTFGLTASANF
ncbi:TonB-dependent receptor [Sphingobium herbicidovorans]|nr:TonB-dependent receptor [Sphingobium sp. MI1205]